MNLKLLIFSVILLNFFTVLRAQNYRNTFQELMAKPDREATGKLLNQWRKATPNDPELYVAFYNYYAIEGLKGVMSLQNEQHGEKSLAIKDKNGKTVAYLNDGQTYNEIYINKAISYIDTGIRKFPARLDMRFGKTYVLGRVGRYNEFTQEIINAVNYGESINLKWSWTDNKPLDDPKKFMLSAIQDYVGQLYNAGNAQLGNMRKVAETVLKYYPDHVESLSNLSITYLLNKDYNSALVPLLKAEHIAPTDHVVLGNIAYCYFGLNDKPNAIKYYELVLKYGDDGSKEFANKRLQELKGK